MNYALRFIGALAGSIFIGFIAASIAGTTIPCEWFGSNFEGACGYGVMWTSLAIGMAISSVSFVIILYKINPSQPEATSDISGISRVLFYSWALFLLLSLTIGYLFPMTHLGTLAGAIAQLISTIAFMVFSVLIFRQLKINKAYCLMALIPLVGKLIVAGLVISRRRQLAQGR